MESKPIIKREEILEVGVKIDVSDEDIEFMKIRAFDVISLLIAYTGYTTLHTSNQMVRALDVCNASWKSSELLARNIRDFIITGEDRFYKQYWDVVNIRSGTESWDKILKLPYFKGKKDTLLELYDDVGIVKEDQKYFIEAMKVSIELIWNEIQAFNWNDGFFDEDGEGRKAFDAQGELKSFIRFTKEGEKDPQRAIDLLYSKEHIKTMEKIQNLAHKGTYEVLSRYDNIIFTHQVLYFVLIFINISIILSSHHPYKYYYVTILLILASASYYILKDFDMNPVRLDIANATWTTSEMLTAGIRNYIVTGDEKYLKRNWEILDVRRGSTSWDKIFYLSWFQNRTETLDELFKLLTLSDESKAHFNKALNESEKLVWADIRAINYMEGLEDENGEGKKKFDNMKGVKTHVKFTKVVKPDKKKAIEVLYDADYLKSKFIIETENQEGVRHVLEYYYSRANRNKYIYYVIIGAYVSSVVLGDIKSGNFII